MSKAPSPLRLSKKMLDTPLGSSRFFEKNWIQCQVDALGKLEYSETSETGHNLSVCRGFAARSKQRPMKDTGKGMNHRRHNFHHFHRDLNLHFDVGADAKCGSLMFFGKAWQMKWPWHNYRWSCQSIAGPHGQGFDVLFNRYDQVPTWVTFVYGEVTTKRKKCGKTFDRFMTCIKICWYHISAISYAVYFTTSMAQIGCRPLLSFAAPNDSDYLNPIWTIADPIRESEKIKATKCHHNTQFMCSFEKRTFFWQPGTHKWRRICRQDGSGYLNAKELRCALRRSLRLGFLVWRFWFVGW